MTGADVKSKLVIVAVGLGAVLSLAAVYRFYASKKGKKSSKELVKAWKAVGRVTSIHVYPIKSCHGIQVDEAECQTLGIVHKELQDRSFMVVGTNNNFLHARIHPSMVLIKVAISDGIVTLTAPEIESISFAIPSQSAEGSVKRVVRVWSNEVHAVDCGDAVARWFSNYIFKEESGARLVHYAYTKESPIQPKNLAQNPAAFPWMKESDGAVFQDNNPFHLMSTESTDDLNSRLDGLQISTLYFRPTITISGVQKPYEEDEWRFVRIGQDAVLRFTKQCDRCVLTTIDPATGIKHPDVEPLRALKKYRQTENPLLRSKIGESPLLGINLALDQAGHIRVGDVVYAGQL